MTAVPESAFVTGGSGFIGGRLIERLVAGGSRVRALARSEGSAAAVTALGAEAVRGDLADPKALEGGARGCKTAFHLAAHLGTWGKKADFIRDNVTGTENALAATRAAGVERFIHCSTEAVLIAGEPLRNVDETAPLRPDSKSLYASTKAQAEQLVHAASAPGFDAIAVRPRFVWGKGDTTLLPELVTMAKAGKLAWIGGGEQQTDVTHVDNVVEGLLLAAERGRSGEAYFLTDGDRVIFREFVSAMLETQRAPVPDRSVPAGVAGVAAATAETTWKLLHLGGEPPLTRFEVWISSQECTLDISKATRELGYVPVKSHADGLAEMRRGAA